MERSEQEGFPSEIATRLVTGERAEMYGPPEEVYRGVAQIWTGIGWNRGWLPLDQHIQVVDVALMQEGLKLGRESRRHLFDNLADGCGYWNVLHMIYEAEAQT
jgi:uncharacterized protein DUF6378